MLRKFMKNLQQLVGKFHAQLIEFRRKIWKKLAKHARQTCKLNIVMGLLFIEEM